MTEFFHRYLTGMDPYYVWSAFMAVPRLFHSSNIVFWLIVYLFVRFELPNFGLYLGFLLFPKRFEPPQRKRFAGNEPLISFLIAGRNPGNSIITCIESILASNYKNIEIIFADDRSTDHSVEIARRYERTGKVRVVTNAIHGGKAAGLNLAFMFARGEFVFILDADSLIFPDTVDNMLPYFEDPRVGGVSPSIFVRNPSESFWTRCQQMEYIMAYTVNQLWRDKLNMIATLSGMGTLFRMEALKHIGGWDMGLGDDTDSTIRLRKTGWKLHTSLRGHIVTEVPRTLSHLMNQRARWTRNMVKQRFRKHRDMGTFRFGFVNGYMFWDQLVNRIIHPYLIVALPLIAILFKTPEVPFVVGGLYGYMTIIFFLEMLMARDMTRRDPQLRNLLLVPFYVFYRIPLLCVRLIQITRELLMISPWHPYVPRKIWDAIPYH
ncbi:MAG TPA: glycosyltransferase [Candidatus Baltobacteraceae bacterium]|jgi:cellulose synthase/poly-beta-1,6-N-acetylglucosamine synthase-like glycosyltransferase|nr:glycosyltransferase [Candidatus Baltobacteraceae bacterium]